MSNHYKAVLLLATFICCHLFMRNLWGESWTDYLLALDGQTYVLQTLARWLFIYGPFVLVTLVVLRDEHWLDVLGLRTQRQDNYFLYALLCCLPMIIGYAFLSNVINLSFVDIMTGSVYPAFFEEVMFRAVLFGALFRVCKWGFIPAALMSSLIFGIGHLYQSHDLGSALMLMAFMAVAGSWFAWLYCECGYRIWYPMWMHFIMNAAYGVFTMSGGAMGTANANIFKAVTIILSLVFVQWLIKNGKPREVSKARLWKNNMPTSSTQDSTKTFHGQDRLLS
ncbi:CPBP family intramembrane glutamic endopeptidase [Thalassotalea euphylliae]|uniref:CPBP family intramembrane glutamic endopeptidase n=1 Tax=Thalassotalea euphylliae TaxID=1655234 RepID=UPI003640FCF2